MRSKPITFAELDRALKALGFTVIRVPGSHVAYEHAGSGAVLVLRPHEQEEVIDVTTLAVVRRTLVENGLIDRAKWEDFLQERSLAS